MSAIVTRGLRKVYGGREAVVDLDLTVPTGGIFGFLGPNGAGKTTTIGMLCSLIRPTAGEAWVAGHDVLQEPARVRQQIGLIFQETTLDNDLTAQENLRFYAELFGVPRRSAARAIDDLLELVGLADRRAVPVRTFSGGMRRRLELARGLLHAPRLLFLDEPTTGLDPQTRTAIWQHLHRLRNEQELTIFLTTHHLEEAEHCDEIAIIDHGELVAQGAPVEMKAMIGDDLVTLRTDDDPAAASAITDSFGLPATAAADGVRVRVPDGAAFVPKLCATLAVPIHAVTVAPPTLDDVFLHHTGRTIRDEHPEGRR